MFYYDSILLDFVSPSGDLVGADQQLMLWLNFKGSSLTDQFWFGYSRLLTWIPMMVVVVGSFLCRCKGCKRNKVAFLLCTVLLLVVLDQLSSSIIKPLVGRLRPSHDPAVCELLHYVGGYRGGRYGFVSGHAANIVGLATWLFLTFRNKITRIIILAFALLMCYSRIYLGVHYPGDVICGAALGATIAIFIARYQRRHFPLSIINHPAYEMAAAFGLTLLALVL